MFGGQNGANEIALAIDDNDRLVSSGHISQIFGYEILNGLGFSVPSPGNDMDMFKPGGFRDFEGCFEGEKIFRRVPAR